MYEEITGVNEAAVEETPIQAAAEQDDDVVTVADLMGDEPEDQTEAQEELEIRECEKLILLEVLLNLLPILGLCESQHQEHASLLRVQSQRSHKLILGVVNLAIQTCRTSRNAA